MIAIVDYGMGNVRSIFNALEYLGQAPRITTDPGVIDSATHLILPGVGAFGDAMKNLERRNLIDMLNYQVIQKRKPFLGICLGLQLLANTSEEHGLHKGLGWFDAEVVRFKFRETELKVPHMGWNDIIPEVEHPLFENLGKEHFSFYFVHSYYISCNKTESIAASCDYGIKFTAAIFRDNIFATQFHPEKSQDNGIQLLENFINWNPNKYA